MASRVNARVNQLGASKITARDVYNYICNEPEVTFCRWGPKSSRVLWLIVIQE